MSVRKDRGARGRLGGPPDPKSGLTPGAGEREGGRKEGRERGWERGREDGSSCDYRAGLRKEFDKLGTFDLHFSELSPSGSCVQEPMPLYNPFPLRMNWTL